LSNADGGGGGSARPMTSVQAAGFHSGLAAGDDEMSKSPEETITEMEREIQAILEQSILHAYDDQRRHALERARFAVKKEAAVLAYRKTHDLMDTVNYDLAYAIQLNLADQYKANKLYKEALATLTAIVRNKALKQGGRLRVEIGNLHFEQGEYTQAVKWYRMALDQMGQQHASIRQAICRNIGIACIKIGQFQEAVTTFESIFSSTAASRSDPDAPGTATLSDAKAGFNLILCYFALGDKENLKHTFYRLIHQRYRVIDKTHAEALESKEHVADHMLLARDSLYRMAVEQHQQYEQLLFLAGKLIAPVVHTQFTKGFTWVMETVRASSLAHLVPEFEIALAVHHLRRKDIPSAVKVFKDLERNREATTTLGTSAATNLAFIQFYEGDLKEAAKYAAEAVAADPYNPKALTNQGNCFYQAEQYEQAQACYAKAIKVDHRCYEALYNLGLVLRQLRRPDEALATFKSLQGKMQDQPQLLLQIAELNAELGNVAQALHWYTTLISLVPTDAPVLARMGALYASNGDTARAFQNYSEAHRYCPTDVSVLAWLGTHYIETGLYEQAVGTFAQAARIEPTVLKWRLMHGSALRRSGKYQDAYQAYVAAHNAFPNSVDCLRFLVRLATDMKAEAAPIYREHLKRLEE
ncbi:TPR-like protein, partial [Caulochytrium protostelioides]